MTTATVIRPPFVSDDHIDFLDQLRESAVTNMFGASSYLVEEFSVSSRTAREILSYWMKSFSERLEQKEPTT